MDIVAICGSAYPRSKSLHVLKIFVGILEARGATAKMHDLSMYQDAHGLFLNGVENAIREDIVSSGGIVIMSPVYNGSMSGILKLTLDQLGRKPFDGLPVALLSHGATLHHTLLVCEHLGAVVRCMGGATTRTMTCSFDGDLGADPDLLAPSRKLRDRMARQASELIAMSDASANCRVLQSAEI